MAGVNKFCELCKRNLPISKYHKKGFNGIQKYHKLCIECNRANWQRKIAHQILARGKNKHLGLNRITIDYINYLYKKQKGKCYWLGIELDLVNVGTLRYVSLDRLDNSKPYIKGNVVLSTRFANLGRNIATRNDMLIFVGEYLKKN
jgi:hypothetical protein